ncbi:MAG: DUF11 domain-containing protein, partial [Chloroflexi bacterium]|nr:DUF11 domain-containing protein [Chloroflexota bacterium]
VLGSPTIFTATIAGGSNVAYNWNLGDGSMGSGASLEHIYPAEGVYTAVVTASNSINSLTTTTSITIYQPATADFTAVPLTGTMPLTVIFTNNSLAATDFLWTFGDGVTSTLPAPTHTYALPDEYTVSLTASGQNGTDTLTKTNYISVTSPVQAAFTAVPLTGTAPLTVSFTSASVNAASYLWQFGDGHTSTSENPTHIYQGRGVYTVTLIAMGPEGTDIFARSDYITVVSSNEAPQAVDDWVFHTDKETPIVIDILANDRDIDGDLDLNTINVLSDPNNGAIEISATTGSITYTPALSFAGIDNFTYEVCDTATPALCDTASVGVFVYTPASPSSGPPTTVTIPLASGSDDAGPDFWNCSHGISDPEIYFGDCPNSNGADATSGFRFTNVPITSGMTISEAYLRFTTDGLYTNDINVALVGENAGDSQTFTADNLPASRPTTNATIPWSLTTNDEWRLGEQHTSPHITGIVQEIINRSDWVSGNALAIIVKDIDSANNHRRVIAFERAQSGGFPFTELVMTYSDNTPPPPADLTIYNEGPFLVSRYNRIITYTLTIANVGEITATNVIISNSLPANTTYVDGGSLVGDAVYWYEPTLAPAEIVQVQFAVYANNASGTVVNSLYGVRADGGTVEMGTIPVVTQIRNEGSIGGPDFTFSFIKTAPDFVDAGGLVTYTLTLTNDAILPNGYGSSVLTDIYVFDDIPLGATYVPDHPLNQNNTFYTSFWGKHVAWYLSELAVGESIQLNMVVRASTTLTNSNYSANAHAGDYVGASWWWFSPPPVSVVTRLNEPTLAIAKTAPASVLVGDPIAYTLSITNSGSVTATNLFITDTMPPGAAYVSGGILNGNVVNWTLPALAPGESAQVGFVVTATETITNSDYAVQADDGVVATGQIPVVTAVTHDAVTIHKTAPGLVDPGDLITYTLTVRNNLITDLFNLTITDTLPAGANYVGGGTLAGDVVSWTLPSLAAGTEAQVQFVVTGTTTLINDTYAVSDAGGILAQGEDEVVTFMTQTANGEWWNDDFF